MAHTLEAAGIEDRPKAGLADAGYWSEANIRTCSWPEMPELLIATTKDWKQRRPLLSSIAPTPVLVSSPTGLLDKLMAAHFSGDIHLALDRPIGGVEKVVAPATFETAFRCLTSTDVPPPPIFPPL